MTDAERTERYPLLTEALASSDTITRDQDSDDSSPGYQLNGSYLPCSSPLRDELEAADGELPDILVWRERRPRTSWHYWEILVGWSAHASKEQQS